MCSRSLWTCLCVSACMYVCVYVCVHILISTCTCTCMSMCTCICVCICVELSRHRALLRFLHLVIFWMFSGMHSKVVLSLTRAILNLFSAKMSSICRMVAEIEILNKVQKSGSMSGECFAPICAHMSRRHVHSASIFNFLRDAF